jgi:adenine C2-methylase RlmN of 23S rRNA A2503 and tRNA A37
VNDSPEHAEALAELLRDKLVMVNVIVYNSTNKFKAPPVERVKLFVNTLIRNKIQVIERYRFGQDIHAACGQLALKNC